MDCLNLGCGSRFHSTWTNLNFTSTSKEVIAHNLTKGICFPDASFDLVYHSHVLEHFSQADAEVFLQECWRVLRPQGVLRVVVPDLEQIVRTYLIALEKANNGSEEWAANYQWILLEMFDQLARNENGGEMKKYLYQQQIPNEKFIIQRCGIEVKNLIEMSKQKRNKSNNLKHIHDLFIKLSKFMLQSLPGKIYSNFKIGSFRQSGEIHQWMYDQYSLSLLLKKCGFQDITKRTATESFVPYWTSYNLDTEPDNSVYKPDSLYIEALKK